MPAMLQQKSGGKKRYIIDEVTVVFAVEEKKAQRGMQRRMLTYDVFWIFSCERLETKKFREDAEKEKQEGVQGQWQRESPAKEYLEQVKCCKRH